MAEASFNNAEPLANESLPEDSSTEEVRRDYLLGRMITDIFAADIQPQAKKHQLEELNGKNSGQLWQMVKWAKKVEYGASEEEYDAIPEQHRGELQPLSIGMMTFLIDEFDEGVKEAVSNVLRPSSTYNYSVHSPPPASVGGAGGGGSATPSTPRAAGIKARVLDVLIHYFPREEAEFRKMPLDTLKGYLANLVEQVGSPQLESLYKNVRVYLKSKKTTKTSVVNLQSKLQYVLPRFANGNRQRFAAMTLPELQAELRTLMTNTQNAAKKEEIRLALQEGKGTKTVPVRQVTKPGSRWTMTKGSPRKARKGRKTRRSKHRK